MRRSRKPLNLARGFEGSNPSLSASLALVATKTELALALLAARSGKELDDVIGVTPPDCGKSYAKERHPAA